ncbi:DUF3231 family protein [Bacillus piscicola]|uniref:DUF3231 family protein n=1 Tax=Bacillus piscicola TaxID=1632684 RepID=UPI001F08D862
MHSEDTKMTSSEIADIWEAYQGVTLSLTVLSYFLVHVEDEEIRQLTQSAYDMLDSHLVTLKEKFIQENLSVPIGFGTVDVNMKAPRLYTDSFFLQYVWTMAVFGMFASSTAVSRSVRPDIYAFFAENFQAFQTLHQQATTTAVAKGLFVKAPSIPISKEVDFVQKQSFLTGWFGERRPLTASEISNLHGNIQRNELGIATLTGFSQSTKSKAVKDYIVRGIEIAQKHVRLFRSVLDEANVPTPMRSDTMVTEATAAPFSDKLMTFHVTGLITIGISYYSMAITTNARRDLAALYSRLIAEIGLYSEDGANLMIENGWLEEPPRMVDRKELRN